MYIAPNTTIKLIRSCPLDTTQEHTLWFDNATQQYNYFNSLDGMIFTNQTYQRVSKGVLRVNIIADDIYDCNYLMFKNTGFKTNGGTGKWFYAFIKSVNYVNNSTSEIEYVIDDMQTWLFDHTLGECFIDREHSETDNIGENLVPENLETGEYISSPLADTENEDEELISELKNLSIVVASTVDINENDEIIDVAGVRYGNIFSGLSLKAFPNNVIGTHQCISFITKVTSAGKPDAIVSVFLMPTLFITPSGGAPVRELYSSPKLYGLFRSDNKSIKNNKLYTYPYTFLYVTNMQGNSAIFPYEYFNTPSCDFAYFGDYSPNPSVILTPIHYKNADYNFDEKITLTGYPQLSFNVDTYKAWLAQNGTSFIVNALASGGVGATNLGMGIGRAVSGDMVGGTIQAIYGGVSLASSINNTLTTLYEKSIMPNQAKGGGSPMAMATWGRLNFLFMHKHIRPEFVSIIDDYFNMFGYATHRVKVPNRNVRPHWCYTKTKGCVVHGSAPADAMRNICQIYDRGVTFWKNGSEVGDYSLDNRPN